MNLITKSQSIKEQFEDVFDFFIGTLKYLASIALMLKYRVRKFTMLAAPLLSIEDLIEIFIFGE